MFGLGNLLQRLLDPLPPTDAGFGKPSPAAAVVSSARDTAAARARRQEMIAAG
jgi:hypothetical protein